MYNNSQFSLTDDVGYTHGKKAKRDRYILYGLVILSLALLVTVIVLAVLYADAVSDDEEKLATVVPTDHFQPTPPPLCLSTECILTSAQLLENMNESSDPCNQYYMHACGGWLDKYDIPSDSSSYGVFTQINDNNMQIIKNTLEGGTYNKESEAENKTFEFYVSCMDTDTMDAKGAQPFLDLVDMLGGWEILGNWDSDNWYFNYSLGELDHVVGVTPFYTWSVGADDMDPHMSLYKIDQIPRSTFLHNGDNDTYVIGYKNYMKSLLVELNVNETIADNFVEDVFEFERQLNSLALPASQRVDPVSRYHNMTFLELEEFTSSFFILDNLNTFYEEMEEIDENSEVICYGPDYLELANELVNVTSDRILHNFMMWKLLDSVAYYLSDPFRDQYTKFHNLLDGKSGKRERWKECQDECNIVFDMAVGAMFVREAFSEDDKAEVEVMIQDIKDAYIDELPNIDWMDDESRSKAEAKAKLMGYEIGYPDYILNTTELDARWEGFEVNRTQFFVNRMSFHRHRNEGTMKWIFKEPNPDEWYLPPQIVNAYYDPTTNNMTFLAGILQSPMYNPRYTMAFNYGAIGMVMGHELTHGFDTIGGMYNHEGALIPGGWYTEETTEGFLNETECVVDLYNSYCMPPWTDLGCIDGELTKSENIADLGGIKQAFYAYNNYYLARNLDVGLIPGFRSNDEVLFLAFSQGWCNKYTTEYLEQMLVSDPHSPAMYRVIGPLSNFEEFGSLYGCTTNDEMNREDKCSVW